MDEIYNEKSKRKIVLDTETTGKNDDGTPGNHRIIEIGCVEVIGRKLTGRKQQIYINPEREVDEEAFNVHHISNEFLSDKPKFNQIFNDFYEFINGAELVIHNAKFDVGFINHEFALANKNLKVENICSITDTIEIARKLYPGQKVSLDALCSKLNVDKSARTSHGALLDAEILSEVFLAMTGGQSSLDLDRKKVVHGADSNLSRNAVIGDKKLKIISPNAVEKGDHFNFIMRLSKKSEKIGFGDEFCIKDEEERIAKIKSLLTEDEFALYQHELEIRAQQKKEHDLSGLVDYRLGGINELQ